MRGIPVSALLLVTMAPIVFSQANNEYIQHNIVSDIPGMADVTDPNLVNPWGISESATSPFWVTDHDKGVTTVYTGGATAPATTIVAIPSAAGGSTPSTPTGQVSTNGTKSWLLANGNPSSFIFCTEDGTISAWNGGTAATIMVNNSGKADYKGIAINANATNPMLYAANFFAGTIDVFDGTFAPLKTSGRFVDPNIPSGFAPFNIWNINGTLYVTYAKQNATKTEDVAGAGNGFVDTFDLNGNLLTRLISNGPLNSPWGVAVAPAVWGAFGGATLVGNFEDGKINAFDSKGNFLGALQDQNGNTIVITGLWALLFGNNKNGGDASELYFAAGITGSDNKTHGLLGSLSPPQAVVNIANAASEVVGPVAPGEIVVVRGFTLGPSPLVVASIPASGSLSTYVGSTSVYFNGIVAPILYASASETSVIVPYEMAGLSSAVVQVLYKGEASANFPVQIAPTAPGLFTLNYSGTGGVVAINSDGTVNGTANAAARGSTIVLYATGAGQTNPNGQDGVIAAGSFLQTPQASVSLMINNQPATVVNAGSAAGYVSGVFEIEAVVPTLPAGVGTGITGPVPVVVTIGTVTSPTGTTINIK